MRPDSVWRRRGDSAAYAAGFASQMSDYRCPRRFAKGKTSHGQRSSRLHVSVKHKIRAKQKAHRKQCAFLAEKGRLELPRRLPDLRP